MRWRRAWWWRTYMAALLAVLLLVLILALIVGSETRQKVTGGCVPSQATLLFDEQTRHPGLSDARLRVRKAARAHLGIPYVYGGTSHNGFDCSGYVQHVFRHAGFCLPRTSRDQVAIPGTWHGVSWSNAKMGDLVRWDQGHIAIYAGRWDGRHHIWEAPRPGRRTLLRSLNFYSSWDRTSHVHRVYYGALRRC